MGRRSHSRVLGVWANGLRVGEWRIPTSGAMEFLYDATWLESEAARPLSLSLPLNLDGQAIKGERVGYFFDNLLPDSAQIRQRLRAKFHTKSDDAFDLLEAIGRDCVGAIQILPHDSEPTGVFEIDATPLSMSEVEKQLLTAAAPSSSALSEEDEFRISLAGAQEKTALTWHDGRWCKPHAATPTTHIFKLPLGLVGGQRLDLTESLENEWLCGRIMTAYGVTTAPSELRQFGTSKALVVTRFDRVLHSSQRYWLRLPQEDLCQATATASSSKYEADGGPGLLAVARVLQGSESRDEDLASLLRAQLLFWMLAATDGHAKNFSIRLLAQGRYRLTPLYDVLSAWPIAGSRHNQVHPSKLKLAMALWGASRHYRIAEITRRHFNLAAAECGLAADMEPVIVDVLTKTPLVIDSVASQLPKGFPAKLFESVSTGLQRAAKQLERMPSK